MYSCGIRATDSRYMAYVHAMLLRKSLFKLGWMDERCSTMINTQLDSSGAWRDVPLSKHVQVSLEGALEGPHGCPQSVVLIDLVSFRSGTSDT